MTCLRTSLTAALVLALGLGMGLSSPPVWAGPTGDGRADASSPERETVPVRVAVDFGSEKLAPEREEVMRDVLVFKVGEALASEHGVEVVEDGEDAAVLQVGVRSIDLDALHYELTLELRRGTKRTTFDAFECEECTEHGMARAVVTRLGKVVPFLIVEDEEPEEAGTDTDGETGETETEGNETEGPGPDGPPDGPGTKRAPLGGLGKAGIGVMAGGVAGVVVGGIVLAQGQRLDNPSGNLEDGEEVDFRPPGLATMAVGGALVITGAALLVVDRVRARKRGGQTSKLRLAPMGMGVGLVRRF